MCVSWCACALYWHCVRVILWVRACTCVWKRSCMLVFYAMLCMKMFVNFHMFCMLVYLCIVCFSLTSIVKRSEFLKVLYKFPIIITIIWMYKKCQHSGKLENGRTVLIGNNHMVHWDCIYSKEALSREMEEWHQKNLKGSKFEIRQYDIDECKICTIKQDKHQCKREKELRINSNNQPLPTSFSSFQICFSPKIRAFIILIWIMKLDVYFAYIERLPVYQSDLKCSQ